MGLTAAWGSLRVTGGVLQPARTNVANRTTRYHINPLERITVELTRRREFNLSIARKHHPTANALREMVLKKLNRSTVR